MAIKHLRKDLIVVVGDSLLRPRIQPLLIVSLFPEPDADGPPQANCASHKDQIRYQRAPLRDPSPLRKASKCIYEVVTTPRAKVPAVPQTWINGRDFAPWMPSLDDGQEAALRPVHWTFRYLRKIQYRRRDIDVSCYGVNALTSAGVRHPRVMDQQRNTASFLVGQDLLPRPCDPLKNRYR